MGNYKKLEVWKISKDLAVEIYKVTSEESTLNRDFILRDQIRKSAISISSNIAEGAEYNTNAQSARYFQIAKGSCAEIKTQLLICQEIGYLDKEHSQSLIERFDHLSLMLYKLIQHRRTT